MLAVQKDLQALNMYYRTQSAAEQHSVKTRKSSSYAVTVPFQKTLHDSPPAIRLLVQTDNAKKWVMERCFIFGCGPGRAAHSLCSRVSILCPDRMTTAGNGMSLDITIFKMLGNLRSLHKVGSSSLLRYQFKRIQVITVKGDDLSYLIIS